MGYIRIHQTLIIIMAILDEIVDWTDNKNQFWRMTVDTLIRKNNLDATDLQFLKNICKDEHGLLKFNYIPADFNTLRTFIQNASGTTDISLVGIKDIENISALSHTTELEFAPAGLTLIYGDNGSGKSSYASVLKHVCATRGIRPVIHPNLFYPAAVLADKKANVFFSKAGNVECVSLINTNIDRPDLRAVNIFDTSSANHYVEGEDEIAFIPHGIDLLDKFANALKYIENTLIEEKQKLSLQRFDFSVLQLNQASPSHTFVTGINSNTTREQLTVNSDWDENKEARLLVLDEEIQKLRSTDPQNKARTNTEFMRRLTTLRNYFANLETELFADETLQKIKETVNNYITSSNSLKVSSEAIFSDLPLNGVGSATWKQLWESARKFYNESKQKESFPDPNAHCPLCLQSLDADSKQRFENFEEFVKNDLQKQFDKAKSAYEGELATLNALDFSTDAYEPTILEIESIVQGYRISQQDYISALQTYHQYLIDLFQDEELIEDIELPVIQVNAKSMINALLLKLGEENKVLLTESIADRLTVLETERSNLQDEKKLYTFRPKAYREVLRLKRIKSLDTAIGKCNTRSLTTLSNNLTQTHVTQLLKDAFKNELNALGFRNIRVEAETRGARGKQYHFLKLGENNASNAALKDILSEGEHRCIALATFLAELSLSEHKSAVVFDDPVSSLDHKWRNKIAGRIASEAAVRQVVVLTHDISFLMMIQEHADKQNVPIVVNSLTRNKQETGIILNNPPWDAMSTSKRIGVLKDQQQKMAKLEKSETEEVLRPKIQTLYGRLRETWERFIEEVFLNDTIKRFGREVQTQRLSKVVDLTVEDYNKVEQNMSKCSTYMVGHDSAGELNEEIPSAQEFLDDVVTLEAYVKEIRKRRN
ncbi:AAA family ATPase [uncultured Flavobacterium sp.]|mgnify:CR=1 FL=1|uniref:AAA family ATPase n=1 Tax=uncultured Flavobacterium sp. TaxID=165435 RepID=UPI000B1E2B57|nr:AAA family ATPase [uncultured Flavobacterium sp.]